MSFDDGGILGNGALGVDVMQTPTLGPVQRHLQLVGGRAGAERAAGEPAARATASTGLATYAPWWTTASGPCDGYGANYVAPVTAGDLHHAGARLRDGAGDLHAHRRDPVRAASA